MATAMTAQRMEMMPARRQELWGWPAVVNFALGGLGAGWYVVAVLEAGFERSPGVTAASWAASALVLAGFAAVAAEAGRPLRGPRVLTRLRTSWMSRELLAGIAFVLLVAADLAFPLRLYRAPAVVAAVLLALAQGFIVRRARGVTAWDVPLMPLLFLLSALVSGAGAYLLAEVAAGRPPLPALVGAVLALVVVAFVAWARYLAWTSEDTYRRAVAPLREGRAALLIDGAGYGLPLLLGLLALAAPAVAGPLTGLAGTLLIAGQAYAKARLIRAAGRLRPITLGITLSRRRSA
ncbi:MAG TPA: DmsC/YnfH family molybdoenzyme membrane anchor subunit [Methylomirabilota bacterium]|nr:DmsC/YnfH family molybdoenzyme membrane anchor subunit [Methylomirabilota bacterium]